MRADIETFLEVAQEATAKTISIRVGLPQEEVAKELHSMHGDGVVEREKRKGGGNEYMYWLTRRDVPASVNDDAAPAITGTTEMQGVPAFVPGKGASAAASCLEPEPVKTEKELAFEKLAAQTRELMEIFGLPPTMTEAIDAARTMMDIATATATERDELKAENESNRAAAARWKRNCAELEQRIDDLTLGPVGCKSPVFVTVGRHAKPMRHESLEKAQKRGKALVRTEKESEVLVCEPVGRIVRGTEWVTR